MGEGDWRRDFMRTLLNEIYTSNGIMNVGRARMLAAKLSFTDLKRSVQHLSIEASGEWS